MSEPIRITFELRRSVKNHCSLRSGNEMINSNDRMHYHIAAELKAHLRELSNIEARQYVGDLSADEFLYTEKNPCHIFVRISPPSNRKTDAPNWYPTVKPLIDGLTDMHMFKDDNDKIITSMTFIPEPKTENGKYRIVLEIRPGWIQLK